MNHTPGPWEQSHHQKGQLTGTPNRWTYVEHNFPDYPYEGDLEEEWGIYPPAGESGPVALVSGKDNARLIAAAPELLDALRLSRDVLMAACGTTAPYIRIALDHIEAAIAKATGEQS